MSAATSAVPASSSTSISTSTSPPVTPAKSARQSIALCVITVIITLLTCSLCIVILVLNALPSAFGSHATMLFVLFVLMIAAYGLFGPALLLQHMQILGAHSWILITVLTIAWMAFLVWCVWKATPFLRPLVKPVRRLCAVMSIVFITTCALNQQDVPRRLLFDASRTEFTAFLQHDHAAAENLTRSERIHRECASCTGYAVAIPFEQQIGVYPVLSYAVDSRGGVYFRVSQNGEGMGPDEVSCGLVYQPNSQATPFGRARYTLTKMVPILPVNLLSVVLMQHQQRDFNEAAPIAPEEWYWFCVSDDYY